MHRFSRRDTALSIRVNLRLCITSAQSLDPPKSPFKRGTLINLLFPPCNKKRSILWSPPWNKKRSNIWSPPWNKKQSNIWSPPCKGTEPRKHVWTHWRLVAKRVKGSSRHSFYQPRLTVYSRSRSARSGESRDEPPSTVVNSSLGAWRSR